MKTQLLILLLTLLPLAGHAGHGEETHSFDSNEFILKNYIKSFESVLGKRVERYNKDGLKWLQDKTRSAEDKNLIKSQIARTNIKTLNTIHKRDHYWVMKVANHRVSFSSADILLSRVYVDGKMFELKSKETLADFQDRLLLSLRQKQKKTSFIDYLIPQAHAQGYNKKRVEEIVILNATGVISISYDEPWWFEIPEYAKDLALAMSEEINKANKECTEKSQKLAQWNTRRMGKNLNKLISSLKTNGRVDHAKLMSSLLKKFSTKNKIDKESATSKGKYNALSGTCEQMMLGWKMFPMSEAAPINNGLTYKDWVSGNSGGAVDAKRGLCHAVKQTVACLENLEAIESKNIANDDGVHRVKEVDLDKKSAFDEVNGSNANTSTK